MMFVLMMCILTSEFTFSPEKKFIESFNFLVKNS